MTDQFWDWFWTLLLAVFVIWAVFGEVIENVFLALVGRRDLRRLSRKDERRLRRELDNARQTIAVANDILRDVQAADRVFPQLPQDTRDRVDEFLGAHLTRPALPKKAA